ncbi:MAG TPA: hypothetical protein VMP08_15820 [Anaerolineae bacterium]|nr:hypothetical protein [Anaerolineae bacterium]
MTVNRVSAKLLPADKEAVLAAIKTIKDKLPFLIDLSPEERHALPKMGDKSNAFVGKAAEIAAQNGDFLPRSFDVAELASDVALYEDLRSISLALTPVAELIDDTMLEVGSEAYAAALTVYQYAKNAGQGAALDGVADELGKRFARKSVPKPEPVTP